MIGSPRTTKAMTRVKIGETELIGIARATPSRAMAVNWRMSPRTRLSIIEPRRVARVRVGTVRRSPGWRKRK